MHTVIHVLGTLTFSALSILAAVFLWAIAQGIQDSIRARARQRAIAEEQRRAEIRLESIMLADQLLLEVVSRVNEAQKGIR